MTEQEMQKLERRLEALERVRWRAEEFEALYKDYYSPNGCKEAIEELGLELWGNEKRGRKGLAQRLDELEKFIEEVRVVIKTIRFVLAVVGVTTLGGLITLISSLIRGGAP